MDFTILSHAGLRVRHNASEVLCDPWIIGSTYWRSWWNFPQPSTELINSLQPSCIYLTHVHWDHFAGPSLRRFDKNIKIIIPLEPVGRMRKDLEKMGFLNIKELGWGDSFMIGEDIRLTAYPFNIFTDSAVVIEAGGVTLLNCNDTKLMGAPLRELMRRHPKIDFVMRSHSSANSRAVTHVIGSNVEHIDNRNAYVDDFVAFAKASHAKVAIPFASNHCHLHPEVFAYNSYIVTPEEVLERVRNLKENVNVEVMLAGDTWCQHEGYIRVFRRLANEKEKHLLELQSEVNSIIELSMRREAASKLDFERFKLLMIQYFSTVPSLIRHAFKKYPILFVLKAGDNTHHLSVNVSSLTVSKLGPDSVSSHEIRIEAPLMVVMQCLYLRLFSHLAISKRAHYYATPDSLGRLKALSLLFNFIEYEYFPLKNLLTKRFVSAWASRWREVLLYLNISSNILFKRAPFKYSNYLR